MNSRFYGIQKGFSCGIDERNPWSAVISIRGAFEAKNARPLDLEYTPGAILLILQFREGADCMTISEVSEKYGLSQDTLRYYERIGVIPPVKRKAGGVRDYTEEDLGWIELAKCMRSAGLSMEALIQYVNLARQGDETIAARRDLLNDQRKQLMKQYEAIRAAKERLDYKISRYDEAMETGRLSWDK